MSQVGGPGEPPYDTGSAQTPPGFGPPGQVPTLNGQPLAAPRSGMSRGVMASLAFFGVLLVVAITGIVYTGGRTTDKVFTSRGDGGFLATATPFQPRVSASPGRGVTGRPLGPVPKPVRYTGTGTKRITLRRPEAGETLVYVKGNAAGGLFLVSTFDKGGKQVGMLVNTLEPYEGVRVLDMTSFTQAHALEVQGKGAWTVELRSARSAKAFTLTASGRGDAVLRYEGRAGTAAIRGGGAMGLFMVMTRANGFPTPVASTVGTFSGSKRWPAGPVLVEVQSSGPWSIRVS